MTIIGEWRKLAPAFQPWEFLPGPRPGTVMDLDSGYVVDTFVVYEYEPIAEDCDPGFIRDWGEYFRWWV